MILIQNGCASWLLLVLLEASLVIKMIVEGNAKAVDGSGEAGSCVSAELALSLRRQLMANNYDYISSSAEDPGVPGPAPHDAPPPPHSAELAPKINEIYISRAHTLPPDAFNTSKSRAPSKKDLLYYVDDRLLSRRVGAGDDVLSDSERKEGKDLPADRVADKALPEPTSGGIADAAAKDKVAEGAEDMAVEESTDTTSTAKYKVLKVKTHLLSRRSGRPVYRRLLQEEGAEGVALINLSDGPFPDFQLPSPHRHRDSDELPPPSVSPEELNHTL